MNLQVTDSICVSSQILQSNSLAEGKVKKKRGSWELIKSCCFIQLAVMEILSVRRRSVCNHLTSVVLQRSHSNEDFLFQLVIFHLFSSLSLSFPELSLSVCKAAKADLAFLVDGSWSIGDDNFQKIIRFLYSTTGALDVIGPEGTQVCAACEISVKFSLLFYLTAIIVQHFLHIFEEKEMKTILEFLIAHP